MRIHFSNLSYKTHTKEYIMHINAYIMQITVATIADAWTDRGICLGVRMGWGTLRSIPHFALLAFSIWIDASCQNIKEVKKRRHDFITFRLFSMMRN